ncbi:MAG: S1 RNA-binding domain-containing protein [Candidatus Diapherotrites archaeon]|nr:S1 RNA-binding domain-containing protein [Candidatus Diapherotrites archaeon]
MDYPEKDELVVAKITKVLNYGVFVELLEYNNARGFVHVSNVASSWVKNIRNFVKLGQVRVAKVLNVDAERGQVDLSLAMVSQSKERQKINDYRQFKRVEKLLEELAKQHKKSFNDVWEKVAIPLIDEFGNVYSAFEKISLGANVDAIIPKEWIGPVKEIVEKNIVVADKELKGVAKVSSLSSTGLKDIKEIFSEIDGIKKCNVAYLGAGRYSISCTAPAFKEAEKKLSGAIDLLEKRAKKLGASFEFAKEEAK